MRLDAEKSWVTVGRQADSYVWSSRPLAARRAHDAVAGARRTRRPDGRGAFDGLGLRGNASSPVDRRRACRCRRRRCSGPTAAGLDIALGVGRCPWFLVLNAAFSVGLMEARARPRPARPSDRHPARAPRPDAWPTSRRCRRDIARHAIRRPTAPRAFLLDTLAALETGRADAMLRVLEVKAARRRGGDRGHRPGACGCAAAPRSARSSASSAASATPARHGSWRRPPTRCTTSSAGPPAACRCSDGWPSMTRSLLGAVAYDPKVVTIWDGFRAWFAARGFAVRLRAVLQLRAPGRGPARRPHRRRLELAAGLGAGPPAGGAHGRGCAPVAMRDTDRT